MNTEEQKLEPFNLAEAIDGRETVTRDGRRVVAIWDCGLNILYPIIAFIDGNKSPTTITRNGKLWENQASESDFFHPAKWRLPDPPEGERWHREDWSEGMLPEGWRPLLLLERIGRDDEGLLGNGTWELVGCSSLIAAMSYHYHLRTRRPLLPIKKRVALGRLDFPPLSSIRHKAWEEGSWMTIIGNGDRTVCGWINGNMLILGYEQLMEDYEFFRPGETSQPCYREIPSQ